MFSEKEILIKMIFIFVKSIIILSLYLHFDKRNNIKRKTIEYLAIFIFCDLYVVIDVIKELKSKSHTTQKALIVVLTVLLIANSAAGFVNIIYNKLSDTHSSLFRIIKIRQELTMPCVYTNRKSETVIDDKKFRIILCRWRWR